MKRMANLSCKLLALVFLLGAGLHAQPAHMAPPPANIPNLPAQRIGARDLIAIQVYDSPELSGPVRVSADGMIRLPMLKQLVKAEGRMPDELEAAVAEALEQEGLIVQPMVTVTIAEYTSRPISVAGAVKMPLTFQASAPVTLLEAITRAGGLTPEAGSDIIISKSQPGPDGQPTSLVQRVPVKSLIDAADPESNLKLAGGEEIRVPEAGKVYVVGNVKRPGAFSVQDGAETSVLRLLAVAEGLAPFAGKQAYIYRREGSGSRNEIPIPLAKILQRSSPDVPLLANDVLYIPDNHGRRIGLAALEKVLMFGSTAGATALIYGR